MQNKEGRREWKSERSEREKGEITVYIFSKLFYVKFESMNKNLELNIQDLKKNWEK